MKIKRSFLPLFLNTFVLDLRKVDVENEEVNYYIPPSCESTEVTKRTAGGNSALQPLPITWRKVEKEAQYLPIYREAQLISLFDIFVLWKTFAP